MNVYISPEEYARAAENGISESTLYQRVNVFGKDKEEAITMPLGTRRRWKWGEYLQIAEANGINKNTFHSRVHSGMHPKLAATKPVEKKKPKPDKKQRRKRSIS